MRTTDNHKGKGVWRKGVAAVAALPMVFTLMTAGTAVAADATSTIAPATNDQNNVLNLGFNGDLSDASPVKNTVTEYKGSTSYVTGVDGQAIKLDKGALSLGASQKLQPQDLSLSFWWNPSGTMTGEQILLWSKAKYNQDGWYLSSASDSKPLVLSIGAGAPQPLEFNLTGNRADIFPANTWTHVMVTFDATTKTAKFYVNGESRAYTTGNTEQPGSITANDAVKYIGWNGAHASGGQLNGTLDDVKLWDTVATTADVEREVKIGDAKFDAKALAETALEKVDIATEATSNLTFDAEASNGASLTYASDNKAVISDSGVVNRPAVGEPDATAKITVTASYGSAAVSKTFTVTVPAQTENGGEHDVEYLKNYLSEQGMENVTVSDAYLQNAGKKEVEYLLSFEPDRLLTEFRATAGLPTNGAKNYGGWENGPSASRNPDGTSNPNRFTGHFVGHWISAVSQAQRSTFATPEQKAELATKLTAVVKGIRETQEAYAKTDAANAGFFPAFSVNYVPSGGNNLIVPFYNLHKVEQGMVHAYEYGTDQDTRDTAKAAAVDFAKWVVNWKKAHASTNMLKTEYGGMNDALYQVAEIADAKDKQTVLEAAHLFDETALFENLAAGKDVLNGLHGNTTIPKFIGAMQRYVAYTEDEDLYNSLSADEKDKLTSLYLKAAENFFDIVTKDHTYVTGGNSQSEHFHVAGQLWHDATQNGDVNGGYRNASTVETCNEYNMLKLSRMLLQVTRDSKYSEYYEHTYINAILASQNPETGMSLYFQPMKAGYPKVFGVSGTDYEASLFGNAIGEFWCDQGTGVENFAKLNDSFYFTDKNDVYVNMFRTSTYTDKRHDLTIAQTADVPKQDTVTFAVTGSGSANLKLRVPDWTIASGVKLVVDGKEQPTTKDDKGWVSVPVKDGTQIAYTLPAKLQSVAGPDNANWVAFQYGPVVLAGALNPTNTATNYSYGGVKVRVSNYDADANAKAAIIPSNGESVTNWLKGISADGLSGNLVRTDKPDDGQQLSFQLKNVDGDAASVEIHPYYSTYKTSYAIYWDMAEVDSDAYQQNLLKKKTDAANADLVSDAVDAFDNEFQQELAHNAAKSDDSNAGTYNGKQYRDAKAGGWFSYDLAVKAGQDNYLGVQYHSADNSRNYDVIVDPTPVADKSKGEVSSNAVKLTRAKGENGFYWDVQQLPADLLAKVKDGKVRVLFKSTGGLVGGVYGVRMQNAKALSADAKLASLKFSAGTLDKAFDPAKSLYTLTVPADAKSVEAEIGVNKPGAYVKVDGVIIDDTKARAIALGDGVTTVEIASYAQNHEAVKYYSVQIVKEGATAPATGDPVVEYTFDKDSSADKGATVDNTGTAGDKLDGTVSGSGSSLVDHKDNGKALKLKGGNHGSTGTVTIPAGAVSADQKDLTVSADYQWDGANGCVYPWALGKDSKDYLVNIVSCGSNTRVEASKNGSQTQLAGSTPAKNTWVHVDVVVKGGKSIAYYLDGKLVATKTTTLTAADFVGTSTASGYLGLSFYSSDKDFGGQIDNFKVWNRALTAAELFNPDTDEPAPAPSDDATLKSLAVAGQTVDLEAAASKDGAELTVDDPAAVKESDVAATVNEANAKTAVTIADGVVLVKVTAADGKTVKTYTVKLVKKVVKVESVTISGDGVADGKLALETGKTAQLTATVAPENADDKTVTWKVTEGEGVVTVGANGLVTAAKAGTAKIVAVAGGVESAPVVVTVTDPTPVPPASSVDSVTVTGDGVKDGKLALKAGDTAQLKADVKVTGDAATTVAWTSSDEKVATVDADGKVTAVAAGEATITATSTVDNTKFDAVTVTVTAKDDGKPEPDKPAPAEKDLTDANKVDGLISAGTVAPGAKLTLNVGKAFAGKTVDVYALRDGKTVLVASGVTVGEDGTLVVTVPADLKLGATKFAVRFADGALVWDAVNVAKPSEQPNKGGVTAATGAAVIGVVGVLVVLAAAGAGLMIWRKRRA
ncbi:beta-1,3-specific beta-L-arabinofuranosidase [Bifidobacterium aesculapii]|uniref:beta-1,3-specific beta-L-arabinofuranosidase n=1 Tax=Bifidobacterium aesculapii TaxID=1329411 RepID=UPI0009EB3C74|nr:beta-L-arabinofuranosidase domain-containing protein [Bifidobacterium aesculapii]